MSATQGNTPVCHWVRMTDTDGRVRMEMRWSAPTMSATTSHAA